MGFRRGVSWIPTLIRSFILSVRSRKWGNGESRLRVENERLDGVPVGETPPVGLLGLGETPHVGLLGLGETPRVGVRMMTLKPLSRCAVLHGQSLSQAVAILLQKAVLSVVLDCLASCPWQGLLVTDAKNQKCCSLTAVLLT